MRHLVRTATFVWLFIALSFAATLPARAVDIQTVVSPKGIKALLVEDYTVPLIALDFAFKGGATQDREGKEGTSYLLTTLLDEGAGDIDSQSFQTKLDDVGLNYRYSAGNDSFSGSFTVLKSDADEAFELVRLMLNEPRFDADPIDRMKTSLTTRLQAEIKDPNTIAARALRDAVFEDHAYARPRKGTPETLAAVTREDLREYRQRVFARDNLNIGVVGAISAEELAPLLDMLFGPLPEKARLETVPEATIETGKAVHVDLAVPQTVIRVALPGIKREDPDFYAAHLVNHILGGGSFSSRLYQEIREKRGLVYGVFTFLATYDHAGFVGGGAATGSERAAETIRVMKEELARMAQDGPTEEELKKAKDFIIGSYAISNLDTSSKIASVLVAIQQADLGIDYIDKRADYLAAVTMEDVKRVAKRLFDGTPTLITVGQKVEG